MSVAGPGLLAEPQGRMPRALIVTTNFPPDASVGTMRTLRLVRHLAAAGCHVDVITAAPERFRNGTITDPELLEKVPAGVNVTRARAWRPIERLLAAVRARRGGEPAARTLSASSPLPERSSTSFVRRYVSPIARAAGALLSVPDREVSWFFPAIAAGWRQIRSDRPDVIYSSGPPFTAHLVGAALARLLRVRWVADFRDPWARAPWREDRFAFERKAWSVLERVFVTRADAVLFVTETNRLEFARHYGDAVATRFHVVPNGCDLTDFDGLARRPPASGERFVLLHAGSLYGARNPTALLKALARAIAVGSIDRTRICVRFIGRVGVPGVSLTHVVHELALDDVVEFVIHMPRRGVLQEMLDASALLILQPVTTVSVPAKLYEYMAARRPVLALAEPGGETAAVVHRSGAGITVPADDEVAIEQALVSLIAGMEPVVPVDSTTYDGALRAQEIRTILFDVGDETAHADGFVTQATPSTSAARTGITRV